MWSSTGAPIRSSRLIVEQVWTGNAYPDFDYLDCQPQVGQCAGIDPLAYQKCLSESKDKGWTIMQILTTHEQGNRTDGN